MSTGPPPSHSLGERDVQVDLAASLYARRELGPEMEDHVIEAFLARVQQRIDAQIQERLEADRGQHDRFRRRGGGVQGWVVPSSLALAIPLLAIATTVGVLGVIAVLATVVGILTLYFEYSRN